MGVKLSIITLNCFYMTLYGLYTAFNVIYNYLHMI